MHSVVTESRKGAHNYTPMSWSKVLWMPLMPQGKQDKHKDTGVEA
jgi:hypothetical protein